MKRDDRAYRRSAGTLSAGVAVAGLLTYLYFALASHNLSGDAYGQLVVLWAAVFVSISVLHRPVEQLISRGVAHHRARGEPIGPTLRGAARIQAAVARPASWSLALILRGPIEDGLLSGSATLYWIYVAAVTFFVASFFARGFLAGEGRFRLLATLLGLEAATRTVAGLALAGGLVSGLDPVAAAVAVAPLVSLLAVAPVLGRRDRGAAPSAAVAELDGAAELGRGSAFAIAVFVVMLSEQVMLNGGPLILNGLEGPAAAGFIFNVLMVARAPLVVFQGIAISLLPHLTRLRSRGGGDAAAAFDGSVAGTLRAVAAFTLLVVAVVALAGPELMQLAFGDRFEYDRVALLIVAVAMGMYLGSTTLNQALLAQGQVRRAAVCWSLAAIVFLTWCLVPIIEDGARRVEVGFGLAAALLCALLLHAYRRPHPHAADIPAPSSAEELEASLALADEAS